MMNWSAMQPMAPTRHWITVWFISNGTTAVSQIVYWSFISALWNGGIPVTIIPLHFLNKIILSDFIIELPEESGWWICVPRLKDRNLQETHKSTKTQKLVSTCFSHFGTLFGLNQDAAVRQLRIISWYLSHHLGNPSCASQHEISKVGA